MPMTRFWRGPVSQYESLRLRRSQVQTGPRFLRWLWRFVLSIALLGTAVLCGVELYAATTRSDPIANGMPPLIGLSLAYLFPIFLLVPATLVLHVSLLAETLNFAARAISREKHNETWESLVLTHQSVRQIALGKWWAIVVRQAPEYLLLSVLRFGVVAYLALEGNRVETFFVHPSSGRLYIELIERDTMFRDAISVQSFTLAGSLILLFTILNLGFTAAVGILAGSLNARFPFFTGLTLRTALVLLPALALIYADYRENAASAVHLLTQEYVIGFGLLENGTRLAAAAVTSPFPQFGLRFGDARVQYFYGFFPEAVFLLVAFYVLAASAGLWLTGVAAKRS